MTWSRRKKQLKQESICQWVCYRITHGGRKICEKTKLLIVFSRFDVVRVLSEYTQYALYWNEDSVRV